MVSHEDSKRSHSLKDQKVEETAVENTRRSYPETISNIHLSQSLFMNIYIWLGCRLQIWVSNWLLCYDFTSPRSCVNKFRVSTYLDRHVTVSQNLTLIFQIKILQVSDKFQTTYSYLDNWLSRCFLWKLLLKVAISDVNNDVPYLPLIHQDRLHK